MISTPIATIADKGAVEGALDAAEELGLCWEAEVLLRSVREAEERRSVTAEVAEVMVVLEDSIWEEVYILSKESPLNNLGSGAQ